MYKLYVRRNKNSIEEIITHNPLLSEQSYIRPNQIEYSSIELSNVIERARLRGIETNLVPSVQEIAWLEKELERQQSFFRISGALLSSFRETLSSNSIPSSEQVNDCLRSFSEKVSLPIDSELEGRFYPNLKRSDIFKINFEDVGNHALLWLEVLCLQWSITQWLFPHKIPGRKKFRLPQEVFARSSIFLIDHKNKDISNSPLIEFLTHGILETAQYCRTLFNERHKRTYIHLWDHQDTKGFEPIGRAASADSLLQLAWFEIAASLEWNLFAGICNECGTVIIQNANKSKNICGDTICKSSYRLKVTAEIENMHRQKKKLPLIDDPETAVKSYNKRMQRLSRAVKRLCSNSSDQLSSLEIERVAQEHDISSKELHRLIERQKSKNWRNGQHGKH